MEHFRPTDSAYPVMASRCVYWALRTFGTQAARGPDQKPVLFREFRKQSFAIVKPVEESAREVYNGRDFHPWSGLESSRHYARLERRIGWTLATRCSNARAIIAAPARIAIASPR